MRISAAISLMAGLLLLAGPGEGKETSVLARVEAGVTETGAALAGPKPFVDIVCPLMQQEAEQHGLPPMPFVRLIWKESRFNPSAVSPKGAEGIAQFMPATAADRGLDDPFEPKAAIVHSASLLADLRQEFGNFGLAPPLQLSFDNPALNKARDVLGEEWGKKAVAVGAGGSIPIVADFKSVLGMDSLLVGFALDDDRVHSPNEKFDLTCYHKGIRSWARILSALAES